MTGKNMMSKYLFLQYLFVVATMELAFLAVMIWYVEEKQCRKIKIPKCIREERERARDHLMKRLVDSGRCYDIVRIQNAIPNTHAFLVRESFISSCI